MTASQAAAKLRILADDLDRYAAAHPDAAADLSRAVGIEAIHVGASVAGVEKFSVAILESGANVTVFD